LYDFRLEFWFNCTTSNYVLVAKKAGSPAYTHYAANELRCKLILAGADVDKRFGMAVGN
jgi:hypothetical protein